MEYSTLLYAYTNPMVLVAPILSTSLIRSP